MGHDMEDLNGKFDANSTILNKVAIACMCLLCVECQYYKEVTCFVLKKEVDTYGKLMFKPNPFHE